MPGFSTVNYFENNPATEMDAVFSPCGYLIVVAKENTSTVAFVCVFQLVCLSEYLVVCLSVSLWVSVCVSEFVATVCLCVVWVTFSECLLTVSVWISVSLFVSLKFSLCVWISPLSLCFVSESISVVCVWLDSVCVCERTVNQSCWMNGNLSQCKHPWRGKFDLIWYYTRFSILDQMSIFFLFSFRARTWLGWKIRTFSFRAKNRNGRKIIVTSKAFETKEIPNSFFVRNSIF